MWQWTGKGGKLAEVQVNTASDYLHDGEVDGASPPANMLLRKPAAICLLQPGPYLQMFLSSGPKGFIREAIAIFYESTPFINLGLCVFILK